MCSSSGYRAKCDSATDSLPPCKYPLAVQEYQIADGREHPHGRCFPVDICATAGNRINNKQESLPDDVGAECQDERNEASSAHSQFAAQRRESVAAGQG